MQAVLKGGEIQAQIGVSGPSSALDRKSVV
jgi:uncharacterized protein GlcG (DUF336 family)